MDKAITSDSASQFIKQLVELGGIHYVDQDHIIRNSSDDTPVGVKTGIPAKNHPIAVFKQGMSVGDYVVLNPFTDVLGNSPERAWFVNKMCAFPGSIIRHVVMRMIEVGIAKDKESGYKANKFVSKWIDNIDEKLLEEAQRIPGKEWAVIFYDRTKRIAQLQSNIGYDELKAQFKTKIRKSSWPIFVDMLKTLLQLNTKKPESLIYESELASIPKVDAILHLLISILERLDEPIKQFTDVEIDVASLKENIDQIEMFREATKWFASATATPDADKQAAEATAPWASGSVVGANGEVSVVEPVATSPVEEAATIAKLTPVGVTYNPNYGTPGMGGGYAAMARGGYGGGTFSSLADQQNGSMSEIAALRPC